MAVEAINRSLSIVLMVGGSTVPITNWLDEDGEDCAEEDAVMAVAGPDCEGRWHTIGLDEFENVTTQ